MNRSNSVSCRWSRCRAAVLAVFLLASISPAASQQQPRSPGELGFPDLVSGLKSTPGCLGVETATTASGKNVIFAWFENKDAVLKWYYSDMHQAVMKKFFPNRERFPPLQGVEGDGPIMAVASITVADQAHFEATKLPISQIAIELYQPASGGIFVGGRFAPEALKVPGMRAVTMGPGGNGGSR
jgi:hypothetical protein